MKIISGGQTGADKGGLEGARDADIETGGTAPGGYRTEKGADLTLRDVYGLTESVYSSYPPRTEDNVRDSDGTLLIGNEWSPGSKLTKRLCQKHGRPCLLFPWKTGDKLGPDDVAVLQMFVAEHEIEVLNVAGNREGTNPGIQAATRWLVCKAFGG